LKQALSGKARPTIRAVAFGTPAEQSSRLALSKPSVWCDFDQRAHQQSLVLHLQSIDAVSPVRLRAQVDQPNPILFSEPIMAGPNVFNKDKRPSNTHNTHRCSSVLPLHSGRRGRKLTTKTSDTADFVNENGKTIPRPPDRHPRLFSSARSTPPTVLLSGDAAVQHPHHRTPL
jgi:hypothetical protein